MKLQKKKKKVNLVVIFLVVALVFADVLLRLPAHAAVCAERERLLRTLLHAYFLGAEEFAGLDAEQKLLRLCGRAERLLALKSRFRLKTVSLVRKGLQSRPVFLILKSKGKPGGFIME